MTDINFAELRELATAALTHRHTDGCYRDGSGPWCVFEPTNIDHWTVLLGLLDLAEKAERYEIHARALDDLARVQSQDGNWNHDAYMHGMANGIILAQNCIRSGGLDEPVFLDAPTVWLADIPAALNPTEANDEM